eukprot:118009-Alexandrium_andersonii.AAC.1
MGPLARASHSEVPRRPGSHLARFPGAGPAASVSGPSGGAHGNETMLISTGSCRANRALTLRTRKSARS